MSSRGLYRLATLASLAMVAWTSLALAFTQQGQQMMRNWTVADRCAALAHKQFPDNNAQSLAKRDQTLQECLAGSLRAPRAPQAPQQQ